MKVKLQKDGCVIEPPETAERAVPYPPYLCAEEPLMEGFHRQATVYILGYIYEV